MKKAGIRDEWVSALCGLGCGLLGAVLWHLLEASAKGELVVAVADAVALLVDAGGLEVGYRLEEDVRNG